MRIAKSLRKILIIETVVIASFFLLLIVSNKSLITYNDQIFQYDIFYETWANMLHHFFTTGELPFYSFYTYLGSDFYSSMLYYCTGNIFSPLLILLRNNIRIYVVIEYILCIYISSVTMYYFLKNEKVNNDKILLFAVLTYTFSGFVLINTGNYMFLRFYAFFPLSLLGVSKLVDNKGGALFVVSIAILFSQNYYLMWPGSILLFLFLIYKVLEEKYLLRNSLALIIKFFLLYLLGVTIISFLLLPGFYYIINNPRIGVSNTTASVFNIKTVMLYILDFIVPNVSLMFSTVLQSVNPNNYHIYASSTTVGLIPFITAISYIKKNFSKTFMFVLLIFAYLFTSVSSLLHGFSNPSFRWIFILIPVIILFSSKQIETNINTEVNKIFIIYIILAALSFIISYFINYSKETNLDLIIHGIFIIINVLLYFEYKRNIFLSLKLSNIIYIFSFVSIIICSCFTIPSNTKTFDSYTIDMLNDTSDDLMFRIYTPYQIYHYDSILQLNESMRERYMSTSTYSSVIDHSIDKFHNVLNLEDRIVEISDEKALAMLGTEYYILPKNNNQNINNKELIGYMNGEYPIYKVNDYKGFSRTFDQIAHYSDYKDTSDFDTTLFVDDDYDISSYNTTQYSKLDIKEKGENHLKGNIVLDSSNILLIPLPNNKGWKILDNGNVIEPISVNGGFIGLPLEAGEHNIEMYFKPYLLKEGLIISASSMLFCAFYLVIKKFNTQSRKQ